jgi:N-acyl-D-amino-acid deacylase
MNSGKLIKNALIIDGSGREAFEGQVIIKDGLIHNVIRGGGNDDNFSEVTDAEGMVLAPGFIDTHSHSELSILAVPEATGKISQGVTTEIDGNCGLSAFPITEFNREHLQELYREYGIDISWNGIADYAALVNRTGPAINMASLCGHNTARGAVAGYSKRELSQAEFQKMLELVDNSLKAGAVGFSSGLIYIPGKFSERPELVELLKLLAPSGKPYTTHLRSEGKKLLEAVDEAIDYSLSAGIPRLHISHLKTAGRDNWHKLDAVLAKIAEAGEKGLKISSDRYPFIESMTNLSIMLPEPFGDMDDVSLERCLREPENFDALISKLRLMPDAEFAEIRLVKSSASGTNGLLGLPLTKIAGKLHKEPAVLCAEWLREDAAGTLAAFKGMSQDNLNKIVACDFVYCGSDESARPEDYSIGRSHPRGFASFPRFINILKDSMPMESIIRKLTALPAEVFGLRGRGLIEPGYAADLVLFEPDKLKDRADFANPHRLSEGIAKVWVNGDLSFDDGKVVNRSGKFLLT